MKICPECKYVRTEQDSLVFPDYECPSCGIIEKYKAKYEFVQLEKQRAKEREARLAKTKKERERLLKEEEERLRREEQERKEKEEADRVKKLAAEKARQKELERKRKEEEERLRKEEQERKKKEEADRVKKLEAEKARQKELERRRKEEEERLKKEAEEKLRQEQEEEKRRESEAKIHLRQQQEKNQRIVDQNRDKIISQTQTENAYQLFDMCPFVIAQSGKGLSFAGFGETKNKSQHGCCMKEYCRLWTYRTAENGEIFAQGCSLQFLGLNEEEIKKNFSIKNTRILQEKSPLKDEKHNPEEQG
jgi:hypothetical protein